MIHLLNQLLNWQNQKFAYGDVNSMKTKAVDELKLTGSLVELIIYDYL